MSGLPLVGDEFAGYRVRSVLGRGGMSVVYQAENLRLSSVIALKVLTPELAADDVFRARFLEESRIAASLNHPNVIPIYDMGSQDDLLYIAMRYVSGTDMRQMIKKRGRILPATALFLVGQAARALDAAHRKGLVHRDVKPGNLLIERGSDDADPDHVYLADFGITKHAMSRSGVTSTGQFLGTIDYVAPEQIRGTSVTGLADQYSLGCVLYECLTGRVPFEKDLDAAIIWAHVEETPTMPTVLRPELPPSACKQDHSTGVTCTAPVIGISGVAFQTYPNLTALYAAHMAKVASLNSGQFKQNFSDCESQDTYGEVAWNHLFQHPKNYTVDQMTMSGFTDDKAAGRVFCNYIQGLEYMVWTQNDGHLMGVVAGPVHGDVWNWWVAVHHNIGLGGASMNMNMNPSPSMSGTSSSPSMSNMSPSPSMSSMGG
jgi:serine/threonine protein kinase